MQNEPTLGVQNEATLGVQNEAILEMQNEPTHEMQNEPTLGLQNEPILEMQNEPTHEMQNEAILASGLLGGPYLRDTQDGSTGIPRHRWPWAGGLVRRADPMGRTHLCGAERTHLATTS